MSEEVSEVGEVAPSAPVVESAPAVDTTSSDDVGAVAEASDDSSQSVEADVQEAASPTSFPTGEDFAWDDWDGDHEKFPQEVQSWATGIQTHYKTQSQNAQEEAERTKLLYDALLGGQEDPRVTEYQTKLAEWEAKHSELDGKHAAIEAEYAAYRKEVDEANEAEARRYADWYKSQYSDIFEDKALSKSLADLIQQEWDLEAAAEAVRLPEASLKVAMEAKKNGVPDKYALQLAQGVKNTAAPKPRPGATITSGATSPARPPEQSPLENKEALSFKDLRSNVARMALKTSRR